MNVRRRPLIATALGLVGLPLSARAQVQPTKINRIGWLGTFAADNPVAAATLARVREGLHEYGYVEGKNIEFVLVWANGNYLRFPDLAQELVRQRVDIIITGGTAPTLAAKRATTTIPIVMFLVGDAIASGIVSSLGRPGGNVTGGTFFLPELCAKRLQLLKETVPTVSQVAVLVQPDNLAGFIPPLDALTIAAAALGVRLHRFDTRRPEDIDIAFGQMAGKHLDGMVVIDDSFMLSSAKAIGTHAARLRIPSIGFTETVETGGLMSYGVDRPQANRRVAFFADRIFKGTRPADIPVELPTKFELALNMKTAKALGITFPQAILLRADRLIE